MATVFVSHSSGRQEDTDLRVAVCDALAEDGFTVRVDKDIAPGRPWHQDIFAWMAECDAAVILLSPAVLDSAWVPVEAAICAWRQVLDDTFRLLPVLLQGLEAADLQKAAKFKPADLLSKQYIRPNSIPHVVRQLKEALAPLKAKQAAAPFDGIAAGVLRALLQLSNETTLAEIATRLKLNVRGSPVPREQAKANAVAITDRLVRDGLTPMEDLKNLRDLLDGPVARKIFRLLAPLWVSQPAARNIPRAVAEQRRAVGLNGRWANDLTAEMYLHRAFACDKSVLLIRVSGGAGEDPEEDIVAQLREEARRLHRFSSSAAADQWLRTASLQIFVLLPSPPIPDEEIIKALGELYPPLTFIVQTGAGLPVAPAGQLAHIALLRPELDSGLEDAAFEKYFSTKVIFRGPRVKGIGQ